ncbi:MAG: hypothetical protein J6A97_01590 [Clostridia bacterium]|nr:hypothetical protein [Clostridia bacterium]
MKLLHRIITPILSLIILPVSFFLPIFRILITSGFSSGETKTNLLDTFGLSEFISLNDIVNLAMKAKEGTTGNLLTTIWNAVSGEKKQEIIDMIPGLHWGAVFAVFFVICIITALVLAIVAAATKKPGASLILSGIGAFSAVIMNASFDAFAKPFLNGAFNLNTILGTTNQLLGSLLGNVASIDYMKLGIAYSVILLIFVITAIFSLCAVMEQKNGDK